MKIYEELLDYILETVGECFDYCLNYLKIKPTIFINAFINSKYVKEIERENEKYCFGTSGVELAELIIKENEIVSLKKSKPYEYLFERSKEFWAGSIVSYYVFIEEKSYAYFFSLIDYNELIKLYPIFHENEENRIIQYVNRKKKNLPNPLKEYRLKAGLSQSELADISGVSLRKIQSYEQRYKDINKCDAFSLFKIANVLNVNIEDLLDK